MNWKAFLGGTVPTKVILWVIGGLILLGAVGSMLPKSSSSSASAQQRVVSCDRYAQQMAHNVAKDELRRRSPGKLDFPFTPDQVSMKPAGDGCRVELSSHVDGQNAFGGPVRVSYTATVVVDGSKYRVEQLAVR